MKHALPNIGLQGGFVDSQDDWGDAMNSNLAILSVLVQAGVLGRVAAVPTNPAQGDLYVLTAAPNAQTIAFYDDGKWAYVLPAEGWSLYDRGANVRIDFDGAAWIERVDRGIEEAPSDAKLYGRRNKAWFEIPADQVGVPEAPADGKSYARKNNDWVEVAATGGGGGGGGAVPVGNYMPVAFEATSIPLFNSQIFLSTTKYAFTEGTFFHLRASFRRNGGECRLFVISEDRTQAVSVAFQNDGNLVLYQYSPQERALKASGNKGIYGGMGLMELEGVVSAVDQAYAMGKFCGVVANDVANGSSVFQTITKLVGNLSIGVATPAIANLRFCQLLRANA